MARDVPTVSVIIPTHDRRDSLQRSLLALRHQTYPLSQLEVIVVADGCNDGTVDMLRGFQGGFTLRTIEQAQQGPGAARNKGAADARGRLLVFLDDDVEPGAKVIEVHAAAHQSQTELVAIGPYFPAPYQELDLLGHMQRAWWHDKFRSFRRRGYRYGYQDLLGGNLSITADLFARMDGFDSAFPCAHEDYEFGVRLIKADIAFRLLPEAIAYHHLHESVTLDGSFLRAKLEGRADVLIGSRHPELRPSLPLVYLGQPYKKVSRLAHYLAFHKPALGALLASQLKVVLRFLERMRLRSRWLRIYSGLRNYWYLRGAAEMLASREALGRFLQDGFQQDVSSRNNHEIEIDLGHGLDEAERRLDELRPTSVRLFFGNQVVGRIAPKLGAERLRGAHLRPILASTLEWPLFRAIVLRTALQGLSMPPEFEAVLTSNHREK